MSKHETLHPQYEEKEYEWRQMRDTVAGSSNVKRSGALYLPIPSAMLTMSTTSSIPKDTGATNLDKSRDLSAKAPWSHPNVHYSAYLQRARFPDITSMTHRALLGISTKKAPTIDLPSSIGYLEERCTPSGWNLKQLFEFMVSELLTVGRVELLVDVTSENKIVFIPYIAEAYTNWKESVVSGETIQTLAVFAEDADSDDEFEHNNNQKEHLVLRLETDGEKIVYTSQKVDDDGNVVVDKDGKSKTIPKLIGKPLEQIPVVVANANRVGNQVGVSPMVGISDVSISIYQKDADMSQAEYMSCNPWLVFIGIDSDDAPKAVGSTLAFVIENSEGDAKYVESSGKSLGHMQTRVTSLFEEALKYGVALLSKSSSAESTETVRLRQESQGATLKSIVKSAQDAIIDAIDIAAKWAGVEVPKVPFVANSEFSEHKISPEEHKTLLLALIEGAISYETYFKNLKKGMIIDDEKEIDEERGQIASDAFSQGGDE